MIMTLFIVIIFIIITLITESNSGLISRNNGHNSNYDNQFL